MQEGARWEEWLVGKAAWAWSRTCRSSTTANSSSPLHHPHSQTLSPAPTQSHQRKRERVIYCYKENPLETKKRNTQKDGKRCFMIKWEQEQSSLEMESRRVCRKKNGSVRVNQWAREGGKERESERGKRCRSRTRLCVRLQLIITDSSSIRHLLRWNRTGSCLTDSCVRRALDFRVTDWCGQLVSQSF